MFPAELVINTACEMWLRMDNTVSGTAPVFSCLPK